MIIKYVFSSTPACLCATSMPSYPALDLSLSRCCLSALRISLVVCRTRFVDSRTYTSARPDTSIVACSVLACITLFYWSPLCSYRATCAYPLQLHRRIAIIMLSALFTTITRTYFPYNVVLSDAFLITCYPLEFLEW